MHWTAPIEEERDVHAEDEDDLDERVSRRKHSRDVQRADQRLQAAQTHVAMHTATAVSEA